MELQMLAIMVSTLCGFASCKSALQRQHLPTLCPAQYEPKDIPQHCLDPVVLNIASMF